MKYKYLILDFGGVLVEPSGIDWDITPKFQELIDINSLSLDEFKKVRSKYGDILSRKVITLDEEYNMFLTFYNSILSDLNIPNHTEISKQIAYDRTYNFTDTKYRIFDNIYNELDSLKSKYTLILLSDNWPCAYPFMDNYKLDKYFDKIYISSFYGVEKKDLSFFDYPINDYNIKPGEALFIDDNEKNLDYALEKNLDVILMDRTNTKKESKYKIINNLSDI